MNHTITGTDLINIGYKEGIILGLALDAAPLLSPATKEEALALLKKLKDYPESFLDDPILQPVAKAMVEAAAAPAEAVGMHTGTAFRSALCPHP